MKPKICVLRTDGTNCDQETLHAFEQVGGEAEIVHLNSLRSGYDPIKKKSVSLDDYHILAIPGGFSHGDYIAAGKILAEDFKLHLKPQISKFIADKKLIIGICNGFQVLVKLGILPGIEEENQTATLTYNDNQRFECRWVKLISPENKCVWTKGIKELDLPIAHGEGKFVATEQLVEKLFGGGMVVFQYADSNSNPTQEFPANPNGSLRALAGICDPTGRIFGLMPHPERYNSSQNHYLASLKKVLNQPYVNFSQPTVSQRLKELGKFPNEGEGLQIFRNGVNYVKEHLLGDSDCLTYSSSGVDVATGEEVVENIKPLLESTWDKKILPEVSGFKAVYDGGQDYFIGATDGVGTKLLVGIWANQIETIGQDLVAMCLNDLARVGAQPMFFLDYLATGKLSSKQHFDILKGIVKGCKLAGVSLLGGETAEMPGMYGAGHFDLAGFVVGKVNKKEIIDGTKIKAGATLLGIESSGIHSNGYSLARKIFFEKLKLNVKYYVSELGQTVGEVLLEPTIIYSRPISDLLAIFPGKIKGMAHITGGGIPNKLPKALPAGLGAEINEGSWPVPKIFDYLAREGPVSPEEMRKTFNMGLGMILVVNDKEAISDLQTRLKEKHNLNSYVVGKVVEGVRFIS